MNTHYIIDNPKQSLRRVLCMVVSLSLPALIATTEAKASVVKPGDTNSGVATNSPQKGCKVIGVVTNSLEYVLQRYPSVLYVQKHS